VTERSERIILGLGVVAAVGHAALYLALSLERLPHPFELEWMESGSLEHVMRVLRGQPLYVAPSLDFVPFPYPPVYYWAAALVSQVLGAGLPALRAVSLAASLGTAFVVGRFVLRESGRTAHAWIAAGIFLGTWRASGLYFDVGRLDSLFTFLVLAAVYVLRFQRGRGGLVAAALLAALAIFTKQTALAIFGPVALWCFWADWRSHGLQLRAWERSAFFVVPLGGAVVVGTLLLETFDGHFLRYVIAVQPGHAIKAAMIGWFFWHDLLLCLPVPSLLAGVWLGLMTSAGATRSRDEQRQDLLYLAVLLGVLVACLVPRIKVGGALNNLILVHAWLVAMLGVELSRILARADGRASDRSRRLPAVFAGAMLVQLLLLVRTPTGWVPDEADLRAGRALATRVAGFEGEVLMPVQGHIAGEAGKRVYAHQMPVLDYSRSGLADARDLRASYEEAIREQRFDAVIDSNTAFLLRYLPEGLLERYYRREGALFQDMTVLTPVSGAQIRAGSLWLPRSSADSGAPSGKSGAAAASRPARGD
jgi:hypothetical protein